MNPDESLFSHPVEQTYSQQTTDENGDRIDHPVENPVFSDRDR